MTPIQQDHRRKLISDNGPLGFGRRIKLQNVLPEKNSGLIRTLVPTSLTPPRIPPFFAMQNGGNSPRRPAKLLVNVTLENSPGAMQVVIPAEDTVGDLVKAALVFYEKEKRRPFLKDSDPNRYDLHYSSFALESLERDEKVMNLGSRNFFLCPKALPLLPKKTCCSEKKNIAIDHVCPWMMFVHLLL
ncbi:uncharacterized protein LOC130941778 [Arachis stenosperma]|uniref:uncharacterized protein LOC130941778 n=1 Tax=Arachis stenosperma TaxID=217475 RepID=UPI0025AD2598|nr:uncharacterized protein LOC130941778 [Arachis stenosperma]